MSSIIIDLPDCGELGTRENDGPNSDTITVQTDHCSPIIEGPPPLVPWWAWTLGAVILLAAIVATGMVRYRRHEQIQAVRQAEIEADVEKANARHTSCPTCGTRYVGTKA